MVAIDTNVLIRLLVDDPGAANQVRIARKTVQAAEQVYIPQIVQVECVWVLQRVYGFEGQYRSPAYRACPQPLLRAAASG
jgi:predicted nucleic-acid-binding protein